MNGQWTSEISTGTNKGFCVLNFEKRTPNICKIMFFDSDPKLPSMWATLSFQITDNTFNGVLSQFLIFDSNNILVKSEDLIIKGDVLPTSGVVTGVLEDNKLIGEYKTNIGTHGEFSFSHVDNDETTKADFVFNWSQFKEFIDKQESENKDLLYRGQSTNKYRLKTSFHRLDRTDLMRYRIEDLNRLEDFINSISLYKYKINSESKDLDALLSLAQHHGYPTPLLDWTKSPYVAAYFALQRTNDQSSGEYVRIYVLDYKPWLKLWGNMFPPINTLLVPKPLISAHELPSMNNNRAIPQQSVALFSNVVDIESFIDACRPKISERFFIRIDLYYSEKNSIMKDLRRMGITAGSLFPGFDGICKSMKEQYFEI